MLAAPVDSIDIRGQDTFSLQRQTNNTWLLLSNNFPLDAATLRTLLDGLGSLRVAAFTKDFVTEPDLQTYGLASPTRQYILKSAVPSGGSKAPTT